MVDGVNVADRNTDSPKIALESVQETLGYGKYEIQFNLDQNTLIY